MNFDTNRPDLTIGVLGTGAMGRSIAQVAVAGGMNVLMADSRAGAAEEARGFIDKMFARAVEKGGMTAEAANAAMERLKVVGGTADFKPCHVVIEAIVENLDVKRAVFAELETIVAPECILVTNTSSLSVTTIAAKVNTAQRFGGLHFFNPVPLMKLVEVIDGGADHARAVVVGLHGVTGMRLDQELTRLRIRPAFGMHDRGGDFESLRRVGDEFRFDDRVISFIT